MVRTFFGILDWYGCSVSSISRCVRLPDLQGVLVHVLNFGTPRYFGKHNIYRYAGISTNTGDSVSRRYHRRWVKTTANFFLLLFFVSKLWGEGGEAVTTRQCRANFVFRASSE